MAIGRENAQVNFVGKKSRSLRLIAWMNAPKRDWQVFARQVLPNGLIVDLIVRGDPAAADIAVCSSDAAGSPGELNAAVLAAVGLSLVTLPSVFRPPATVIDRGKIPVLVVQTIGFANQASRDLLVRSMRAGLEELRESDLGTRIDGMSSDMWLPLLATGTGGLSPIESTDAMMGALAAWEHPTVRRVWLSAPDPNAAATIAEHWRTPTQVTSELSLATDDMEPHVAQALAAAQTLAAGADVTSSYVLRAIVGLPQLASPAFEHLRSIVAMPPVGELQAAWPKIADQGIQTPLKLSAAFEKQLKYAQTLRQPHEARHRLWGRDLITAALFADGLDYRSMLAVIGRSAEQILVQWYHYVTTHSRGRSRDEWDTWWHFAGVTLPLDGATPATGAAATSSAATEIVPPSPRGPSRAGYFADTDQGKDCLGIEQEAEALARLILDENVDPPLSIGLLGDWGSGKSFFIEQLKREVEECRGAPGLHKDVVQIEFNAWHVSDGNLWASLVTHIFDEIWKYAIPAGPNAETARAQLVAEMTKAEGAMHEASAEVDKAKAAVNNAEERRSKNLVALSVANVVGAELAEDLKERAKQAGWQRPLENLVEAQAAARALANTGEKLRMQLSLAVGEVPRRFVWVIAIAAIATALWWGIDRIDIGATTKELLQHATRFMGIAGAVLSALVAPLRSAKRLVDGFAQALARAQQAPRPKAVESARRDLETTEASLAAAHARLAELRNQQAALDPAKRLGAFLEERAQSTQYRAQQGIIALVHRDFKQLSERMAEWRREKRSARPENGIASEPSSSDDAASSQGDTVNRINSIDRIVLYVDDLDRCRPEHVVSTLEAVHLLLALDLFVVVVAVDSRWLIRALEVQYRDMLSTPDAPANSSARGSTATDYLEKIFQLTYALPPMDPTKFGQYVDALTGTASGGAGRSAHAGVDARAPIGVGTSPSGSPRDPTPDSTSVPTVTAGPIAAPTVHVASSASTVTIPSLHAPVITPHGQAHAALPPVQFDSHEKDMLKALVAVLPTPRMAKRLVNVYRLIKATRPGAVATEPRQKATLFLLAVLFGRPAVGGRLLRYLHERNPPFDREDTRLADAITRQAEAQTISRTGDEQADWEALRREVAVLDLQLTVGDCEGAPEILARYSFVTGHEWHTWSAAPKKIDAELRTAPRTAAELAAGAPIN